MNTFSAFLSSLVVIGLTFAALGWRHSLRGERYSPEWFFAMAKVLFALGLAIRLITRDILWGVVLTWETIPEIAEHANTLGAPYINVVSSLVVLAGVYCSLKARQLILLQDRGINWHWTIAWAYPSAKTIIHIIQGKSNG